MNFQLEANLTQLLKNLGDLITDVHGGRVELVRERESGASTTTYRFQRVAR